MTCFSFELYRYTVIVANITVKLGCNTLSIFGIGYLNFNLICSFFFTLWWLVSIHCICLHLFNISLQCTKNKLTRQLVHQLGLKATTLMEPEKRYCYHVSAHHQKTATVGPKSVKTAFFKKYLVSSVTDQTCLLNTVRG